VAKRAQLRRNDRNDFQDHPLGAIAAFDEAFDDLQPLDDLLGLERALRLGQFLEEVFLLPLKIQVDQHVLDGLGPDAGGEGILAIFVLRVEQFILGEELILLKRGQAGLGDDVAFEVQDPLKLLELHVQQQADAARERLQKPDMRNRGCQFDMAHPFTADLGDGHLDAALLAHDALVLHALVLAAQALIVLHGTKDARAEEAVPLRLEGPVVDRLRLLDLAERPAADLLRARDADLDLVERLRLGQLVREFGQFVHVSHPLSGEISSAAGQGGTLGRPSLITPPPAANAPRPRPR
jgi:hypothetical protein